jgi:holo-[acyl-carrier protein] synthase
MIIGIGIDLCSITKITNLYSKHPRFSKKILTQEEFQIFKTIINPEHRCLFLAKIWSAKEAFAKATQLGLSKMGFHNLSLLNHENGAPYFKLNLNSELAKKFGNCKSHVSISHENDYVIVQVLLESC